MGEKKKKQHKAAEGLEEQKKAFKEKLKEARRTVMLRQLTDETVQSMIQTETKPFQLLMAYYRCAMMEIETKFKVLNEEFSLDYDRNPISSIKTRLKTPNSIIEKMHRKGIPYSVENIEKNLFDIAGVRVICSFRDDIYFLADCLLAQDDVNLVERKDYMKNPKENGYRSLHLIVEIPIFLKDHKKMMKVEVQFRTIAMDFWASLEHQIKYKKDISGLDVDMITQELRECAEDSAKLDERMMHIKNTIAKAQEKRE
ncbi:MAG: GTP pyrophosphokinase family protein [Lachnospiraceae bacterium]|nr:GTP pyrophosphokinase family protein [Lachnospiraceae bacterium]